MSEEVYPQFNPRLIERTPQKWIEDYCQDGDLLKIHKLESGLVLHNERNNQMYILASYEEK